MEDKKGQFQNLKGLADFIKRQQRDSVQYTGSSSGQQNLNAQNLGMMTFNGRFNPNQTHNSIIQEAQSSQMETSSRPQTSHRTTIKTIGMNETSQQHHTQVPQLNMSRVQRAGGGISTEGQQYSSRQNNHNFQSSHSDQALLQQKMMIIASQNPLKSTTSANSNPNLTPILRSARNRHGIDSDPEEIKEFTNTHTEFTETVNDDEDDVDNDVQNESQDSHSDSSVGMPDNLYQGDASYNHLMMLDNTSNTANQLAGVHNLWPQGFYVLFVDPESFIYYRKDLRRDDYIVFEPFTDENIKKKFHHDNQIHLYKIRKLLVLEGFSWNFKGEADLYRRRPFPRQFLQNEASDYPCYVFQSELSKAFNHLGEIETIVDLLEYKSQLMLESGMFRGTQGQRSMIMQDEDKLIIRFKESLVTSTKEFIKNILRKVYEKYKFKIKPKSHNNLILKADGYREYFEGNYQLLQYERVRTCLRKNEPMKLILTEIPKNYRDRRFPPIFKMNYEVPPADNSGSSMHQADEGFNLGNDYFNFNTITGSSPYFWYSPVSNLKFHHEKMEKSAKSSKQPAANSTSNPANISQISMQTINNTSDKAMKKVVYVAPEKDRVSLTEHRHLTGGTTIPKQNEQIVLLSGECNWRFKFRLVGMERLNVIFNEIKQRVATDNLNTEPRNVTLKATKVQSKKAQQKNKNTGVSSSATGGATADDPSHQDTAAGLNQQDTTIYQINNKASVIEQSNTRTQSIMNFFKKGTANPQPTTQLRDSEMKRLQLQKDRNKMDEDQQQSSKNFEQIPSIIKKTQKVHQSVKDKNQEEFKYKKKKNKHGHGSGHHLDEEEERYLGKELQKIHTPYCNFSNNYSTINHYQNILGSVFSKMTPLKLVIECTLYHGCEMLTTHSQFSDEVYFNNTVRFDQWIAFGNLRYCQIPMKTRLSFNINMLTKEGQSLTIGCVSLNLFDEKGRFRNGLRELNVWPFYELDERLGCMKEYNGMTVMQAQAKDFQKQIDSLFTKLVLEFESFICPLYYSSRDEKKIDFHKLSTNKEDKEDKANLINVQVKNQDLAKLKRYLNQNPLTKIDEAVKRDLFKCREHYQTHPQGLPIFLRSVQWNRPIQVNEVYKMLQNWAPMKPEEAISLLDAKFPDERVRQYAVARISQLSDDDLALYMLQFAQALLYEEQHYSPLAEMLIERSLRNPYVVGHAFYWSLKSNLYLKPSYERYYVLLEQFLMLCGKFKEEIWIQQKVNSALKQVSENVVSNRYKEKIPFAEVKEKARHDLRQQRKKLPFLFTLTIDPKIVIKEFKYEKLTVFSSKKVPLCLTAANQQPGGDQMTCIFKNGDDLRQDILTLQIIYIMDKIWLANNLDLAMTPYKVVGTECEQGFLEFVGDCKTLAYIQYKRSVFNTFSDDTIEKYIEHYLKKKYPKEWEARLRKVRQTFIRSTAGYCVASYVLGLGDRHPDNIMINREEGNFLHIDFGHFLGNVKKKFGVKRERDPFVFSKELAYFINGGPLNKRPSKIQLNRTVTEDEHRVMSESILSMDDVASVGSKDSEIDESMKTKNFKEFEDKCCQAYNILRKEGHQLINMFLIMLSAGMPELKKDDDIQFMVNRLDLGISEQEASNKFKKEIQRAMQTYSRRFDNFIHNIKAKFSK